MSAAIIRLARQLAQLERQVQALSTPQLATSSVELSDGTEMAVAEVAEKAIAADINATTALESANGKNVVTFSLEAPGTTPNEPGDTWFQREPDTGNIIGQWEGLGGTEWGQRQLSHQVIASLDLGKATVGKLGVQQLETGDLTANVTVTGRLLAGDENGAHLSFDEQGFRQTKADGSARVTFPTDDETPAQFEGKIITDALTIEDHFILKGQSNELSPGSQVRLSNGSMSASTQPTLAVGYQTYTPGRWSYLYTPVGHHCDVDDSPDILGATTFFSSGIILGRANKWWSGPEYTDASGDKRTKYGNIGSSTPVMVGGQERLVINSLYISADGGTPTGRLTSLDLSTMSSDGTTEPVQKAYFGAKMDDYLFYFRLGRSLGPVGGANYSDRIAMALNNWNGSVYGNGLITLRQYVISDNMTASAAGFTQVGSNIVISSPLAADEQIIGVTYGSSVKLGFPGADQFVWLLHGSSKTYAYNATGTARLSTFDFPTPPGAARMSAWGDLATNGFIGFRTTQWSATSPVTKLTNNHWTSTSLDRWWVAYTWHDADPAGGTHETAQSTPTSITMKKRAGLVVTIPPFPERPYPNTTDDVLAAKVYVGRGTLQPDRTVMEFAGTVYSPSRALALETFVFPSGLAASPPPNNSTFPDSSPAEIASADGAGWYLLGDGTASIGGLQVAPGGATSLTTDGPATGVMRADRRLAYYGAALRNSGSGWGFIDDAGHRPSGLTSVVQMSDRVRVNFAETATKVSGWSVDLDETLSAMGYRCGTSVGTNFVDILFYRDSADFIADYVYYDGSAWVSFNGIFTPSWAGSGLLNLNHEDMGTTGSQAIIATSRSSAAAVAGSYGATLSQVYFYTGAFGSFTATPTPNTTYHKVYVVRYGRRASSAPIDPAEVMTASGNLWLCGFNEV